MCVCVCVLEKKIFFASDEFDLDYREDVKQTPFPSSIRPLQKGYFFTSHAACALGWADTIVADGGRLKCACRALCRVTYSEQCVQHTRNFSVHCVERPWEKKSENAVYM